MDKVVDAAVGFCGFVKGEGVGFGRLWCGACGMGGLGM